MSKPQLFLETTIQIERVLGSRHRQAQLRQELANYQLVTSTYIFGEYQRTIIQDAIRLHQLATELNYFDDLLTAIGQHINKRQASRMKLLLASVLRLNSQPTEQSMQLLRSRLDLLIEPLLINRFWQGIDKIIDVTQCGLAQERVIELKHSYQLRTQCIRKVRECNLAEEMVTWQPQLHILAAGLAQNRDKALKRMGALAAQIIDQPVLARGRNCTWYLGDMVIALTLPADIPLYTTNRQHFAPLLNLLGKQLHTPTES